MIYPIPDDAFTTFVVRYLDDLLDPAEFVEFERQLQSDPDKRRRFWKLCQQAEELRCLLEPDQAAGGVDAPPVPLLPEPPTPTRAHAFLARETKLRRWGIWGLGIAAALIMALVGVLFRGGPGTSRQDGRQEAQSSVAEVLRARAAVDEDGSSIVVGGKFNPGKLSLASGILELQMANGALLLLEAPAELDLLDSSRAFLHAGKLVVRVPDPSARVEVSTIDVRMRDRGTEFGVAVDAATGTTIQVFDGAVETVQTAAPENARLVRVGEAVRVQERLPLLDVPFAPNRFVRVFPPEREKRAFPANRPRFDTCHIVPAPGPVTIDGDLSDWDQSGEFHSWCAEPFATTYQARGYFMYDDRFLYIAAQVSDPFPMASVIDPTVDGKLAWQGGGVKVRLSTDPGLGWPLDAYDLYHHPRRPPLRPQDVSNRLVHLTMWYYKPAEQPCLHLAYGMTLHSERANPAGYRGAFHKHADGKGYTLEYAVPWELLGIARGQNHPKGGDVTAACWTVHWAEADGRIWAGHLVDVLNPEDSGWTYKRAATWGKAVWHEKGHLPPGTVKAVAMPQFRLGPPGRTLFP
jgi:ferric-dicitrate binding protein FerR (iron transport regulator)